MATPGSVEFLEPGPSGPAGSAVLADEGPDAPSTSRRPGLAPRAAALLALVLLGGAAALAVTAPFRAVYIATTRGTSGQDGSFQVDGWGRYGSPGRDLDFFGHADRYGILLVAAAAVLVLAALTCVPVALRRGFAGWPAVALGAVRVVSLVCAGVLGAVAGIGKLRVDTEYDALISAVSPGPFGARPSIIVVGGGFVMTTLAAAVAALLGALVTLLARGRAARDESVGEVTPAAAADGGTLPDHLAADAAPTPNEGDWMSDEELLGG